MKLSLAPLTSTTDRYSVMRIQFTSDIKVSIENYNILILR